MLHQCRTAEEVRELARQRQAKRQAMFTAPRLEPDVGRVERKPIVYVAPEPEPAPEPVITQPPVTAPEEFIVSGFVFHPKPTVKQIVHMVAKRYNIEMIDIVSERRTADVVRARQLVMYLAKTQTTHSYPHIGRCLGGRDHTTCLHGFNKINRLRQTDPQLDEELKELAFILKSPEAAE